MPHFRGRMSPLSSRFVTIPLFWVADNHRLRLPAVTWPARDRRGPLTHIRDPFIPWIALSPHTSQATDGQCKARSEFRVS